jgi:hypothetical protein
MTDATRIHLVAIDLDGTLLNSAKRISDTTGAILRAARREAGVHIVLASARPPRTVMPFYCLLDLDAPMINYNGALVYDPPSQRVLMHRPIAARTAARIVALARDIYPQVLVSGEILDRWYTDRVDPAYQTETGRIYEPDVVAPLSAWLNQAVTKLLLLGPDGQMARIVRALRGEFAGQLSVVQTEGTLLQIMHATVSKAQALRVVAGEIGVHRGQVMAIGDNANDIPMLEWAGIGVAMGNAPPAVQAVADHVTDHHDADGAAKAIHELILKGLAPKKAR